MNSILDNRNKTNWPVQNISIGKTQITATMAGPNGFSDVTSPDNGTGVLTDANGISYNVRLPGLISQPGTLNIAFARY